MPLLELKKLDERFENLKKFKMFSYIVIMTVQIQIILFNELTSNEKTDFSRYNYFHASYASSSGKIK